MVPTGWDSRGKINVLREGFDAGRVYKAWEVSLRRAGDVEDVGEEEDEDLQDLWVAMIPDTERAEKVSGIHPRHDVVF